jgi:hypothetical protein
MAVRTTNYPALRQHLSSDFAEMSDQRLEAVLKGRNMDAEAVEGFFDDLGKFASSAGKAVLKAAPSVLPIAGRVVGTVFGGPAGGALGGSLGSLAGGAIGAATGQGAGASQGSPLGALLGSPAAGQLLQTVLKPQTLQALSSMALGPLGKPNIPVGGMSVPVSAFSNLLGVLAGRAEAEYNASVSSARGDVPKYMQDYAGEAKGDPAIPEHRAGALYELLEFESEQESEQESSESAEASEFARMEREMEAFQAEYDAMELQELYESESEDY